MPLDGFHVVQWASSLFGSLSPVTLGGLALLVLIVGVSMAVGGGRQVPLSWALIAAGLSACVLSYFIVGTAVNNSGGIQQNTRVDSAAWIYGPYCTAIIAIGVGGYVFRLALRAWSSDETSGKPFGVLLLLVCIGLMFVGVQLVRGAFAPSTGPARARALNPDETTPGILRPDYGDQPVRRRVVAPIRR